MTDAEMTARIVELASTYDPDAIPEDLPSTDPDDDWGYSFITFTRDHLEEEFPGLTREQFIRCYLRACDLTDCWSNTAPAHETIQ